MSTTRVRSGLLALAAFAAYAGSFHGIFQFDDYNVIVDNPGVHSLSAWFSGLPGIRPLLKLSYTVNWISGGLFSFHLFNIAVHAANTVLVYLLSRRFCSRLSALERQSEFISLVSALLFALHPVQTEAVVYICGRSMSLMALFYFSSMLAYVRERAPGRKCFNMVCHRSCSLPPLLSGKPH